MGAQTYAHPIPRFARDDALQSAYPPYGAGQGERFEAGGEGAVLRIQEVSRAQVMVAAAEEWAGHYRQLAVYLRLNGLLPPTAKR
jgi:hypothetical protein